MADAKPLWAKLGSLLLEDAAIGLLSGTPGLQFGDDLIGIIILGQHHSENDTPSIGHV